MKKRKLLSLILALMCAVSAFSGCKDKKAQNAASDVVLSDVNEFPIVEEKVELTVFAAKSAFVADFETNEFTKWYEEKTNVHINWIVPSGDEQQSFNLMIASGEYPDIILGMGLSREQMTSLVSQGIIYDIKDEIDKHGYYIKKMFKEEPSAEEYVTIDGGIYGVPQVSAQYSNKFSYGMWVYKPWLEKLGIDKPKTTEEFYQMLKAFKEKDPNGNGKADEIPFCGRGVSNGSAGIEAYLMSAFIPSDGSLRYYVDNGKVKYTAVQPEYREGLRYMKKLYDEGLLYQDAFIIDRNQLTAIGESEPAILGASTGSYPGYFCNPSTLAPRYNEFTVIEPLEGPAGVCAAVPIRNIINGNSFIVMKGCKHPDIAVKWVDWLMSSEGRFMSQDSGLTNVREAKEGELGVDGKQAIWTIEEESAEEQAKYSAGTTQNLAWRLCGIMYTSLEDSIKTCDLSSNNNELYKMYSTYKPYGVDTFPLITIAEEDVDEFTDYQMIKDEVDAAYAKFVTGELDLDKDWDSYVEGLNGLGLKKYMELLQRNYDAMK